MSAAGTMLIIKERGRQLQWPRLTVNVDDDGYDHFTVNSLNTSTDAFLYVSQPNCNHSLSQKSIKKRQKEDTSSIWKKEYKLVEYKIFKNLIHLKKNN